MLALHGRVQLSTRGDECNCDNLFTGIVQWRQRWLLQPLSGWSVRRDDGAFKPFLQWPMHCRVRVPSWVYELHCGRVYRGKLQQLRCCDVHALPSRCVRNSGGCI